MSNQTTLNILGTDYTVEFKAHNDDPLFKKSKLTGYCDEYSKIICLLDLDTSRDWDDDPAECKAESIKETFRHEIIHAFLDESGLSYSAFNISSGGWAKNEEMVDWIAIQFHKIEKVVNQAEEWLKQWQRK